MENNNQENINEQFNRQFGQTTPPVPPAQPFQQPRGQMELPNSIAVLVLGILSIVGCFCYALPGLVMGIIAMILAGRGMAMYNQNPALYTEASVKNLKAGRVCGIVGLSISAVGIIIVCIYIALWGAVISALPWATHMR